MSMEWMSCGECGIEFQVPAVFYRERHEHGGTWYCPNGHARVFREREVDRLRKQLAREESRRGAAEMRAEHEERRARTYKGHLTRTKRRVANGVCPCCKRTFANLARHMTAKHPDYAGREE